MSLARFTVRNEYGLGRPELYGCGGREDPKEILNGVSVSGLLGILRQLGDLSEFAAEIFQGLQEEAMSTASRSRKLMSRVRNLEDALPVLEKQLLAQTSHIHLAYTSGYEWHPRVANEQNQFIYDDLPRFIMDSYDECNDPPSLNLLDKFDTGGPGSCLRRYSDPTFMKRESARCSGANNEIQRDMKNHKMKKKRLSQRNWDILRMASMSNQTTRRQFSTPSFSGRTSSSQTASTADMASKSDLRDNSNSFDSKWGEDNLNPSMENGDNTSNGSSASRFTQHTDANGSVLSDAQSKVVNDNFPFRPFQEEADITKPECLQFVGKDALEMIAMNIAPGVTNRGGKNPTSLDKANLLSDDFYTAEPKSSRTQLDEIEKQPEDKDQAEVESEPVIAREQGMQSRPGVDSEQDTESEGDIYVDAHYSIELESESDRSANIAVEQNSSNTKKNRVDRHPRQTKVVSSEHDSKPEGCSQDYLQAVLAASNIQTDERISCSLHAMVTSNCNSDEQMLQVAPRSLELNEAADSVSGGIADIPISSDGESGNILTSLSKTGVNLSNSINPLCISDKQYHHETLNDAFQGVQSVKMWTNGNLLGLEPSKPSAFSNSLALDNIAEDRAEAPIRDSEERVCRSVENTDCPSHGPSRSSDKISHSSPRLEHMKISFNPKDGLKNPNLKPRFSGGIQYHESGMIKFPAFQLVPDPEFSMNGAYTDSDDDTFCRSSACVSDEYPTENISESNSEQWEESDESLDKKDAELYDGLRETPTPNTDAVSGNLAVEGNSKVMLAETEDGHFQNSSIKLQDPVEPALPPLPPAQWRVPKTPSGRFEDKQWALPDELERALRRRISLSAGRVESQVAAVSKEQSNVRSTTAPKPENKVHQKLKLQEDCKRNVNGKKNTDMADFLHQIRTKQFNLRHITTTQQSAETVPTTNPNIHAILEKANSIRQAVASDDGNETDAWSET